MLHPLRLKRLEKGWSQWLLSREAGVPQALISYTERGYPSLKRQHKEAIAKVLGCSIQDLFPNQDNG
jgi:transcriptional regulator with XRE-family HTH domain